MRRRLAERQRDASVRVQEQQVIKGALVEEEYSIQDVAEPTQKDSNNCGVFVCRFFWSCVSGNEPEDLSDVNITKLRWEVLAAILKAKRQ
ncbi:hypothetical protein GQ600_24374 [Phytophthora cactorum]|nr:hypothetical protein GQ600_24374 [Phytophthora cactorum]